MENIPIIDINKIEGRFLRRFGDFGIIFSKLKFVSTTDLPTAATDGKNIYYNPEFLSKLSTNQQTFIIGHEVLHVAFNHLKRRKDKNPELWNIATDAVINAMLKDQGLEMVEGGVDMEEGLEMSAEQIYEKLLKEQEKKKQEQKQDGQNQDNQSSNKQNQNDQSQQNQSEQNQNNREQQGQNVQNQQNKEFNPHDMWDKVFDNDKGSKGQKQEKNNKEQNLNENEMNNNKQENKNNNSLENEEINESEIYKKIKENSKKRSEQQRKQRLDNAVKRDAKEKMEMEFSEIGTQKPIISWQSILRAAARGDQDFSYANATIEHGILQPHLKFEPKPETEILLDTSGSISEQLLKNFLRECKNIFSKSKIKAGCFDTRFYGFHEIKNMRDIDSFKIEGRGGTNFDAAVNAFSRRVENHIIFTDGESQMPKKVDRAIWVVFGDEHHNPRKIHPKGALKVIYISREQYKKLCENYVKEEEYER